MASFSCGGPCWIRTSDPLIKRSILKEKLGLNLSASVHETLVQDITALQVKLTELYGFQLTYLEL